MNKLDDQYIELCKDILKNGVIKNDRTGTGTMSVFGREIRHNMSDGFPILTSKYVSFKTIVTELLWFLKGDTNIKYLVDNNCYIWVGDAYKNYCNHTKSNDSVWNEWMRDNGDGTLSMYTREEFIDKIKNDDMFAKKWGELGPIYGKQWRKWDNYKYIKILGSSDYEVENNQIDQIHNLINLLKTNPDSRRLLVNAWNVADIDKVILPPCHYGFQCYTVEMNKVERYQKWLEYQKNYHLEDTSMSTEELMKYYDFPTRKLSLKYTARSQDVPLGTPFNISSYALLLIILSIITNMIPNELIASMGDAHIYLNQLDGINEQLIREPYELPTLKISDHLKSIKNIDQFLEQCMIDDFKLINYKSHQSIKFPLSN